MRNVLCTLLLLVLVFSLLGQNVKGRKSIDDFLLEDQQKDENTSEVKNDQNEIVTVLYEKKDARKAMLFSMLVPGAGQYYADKSAITTYVFPIIEVALISGIIYFNYRGNSKTDDYEKYATGETVTLNIGGYEYVGKRYDRAFQTTVQNYLIGVHTNDIYDSEFFRLDSSNNQHFYEDIGKYNKYIYGWADWYHTFASDATGNFVLDQPEYYAALIWSDGQAHEIRWVSNYRISDMDPSTGMPFLNSQPISPDSPLASPMRKKYVKMRQDAETEYTVARTLGFMMAINHIASGIDAIRVTQRANRYFLSDSGFKINYYADLRYEHFTPTVALSYRF